MRGMRGLLPLAVRQKVRTTYCNSNSAMGYPFCLLREALGKRGAPLKVIVSGSGGIDLRLPGFAVGKVAALIVTTTAGAQRLRKQTAPDSVSIRAIHRGASAIPANAIRDQAGRVSRRNL